MKFEIGAIGTTEMEGRATVVHELAHLWDLGKKRLYRLALL
jgi:hypothetical protein